MLNHLVRLGDGKTPLARAFQAPKTTMTRTPAGLDTAGLIRFAPNPKDGRSKCVMLTDAGWAFRDQAIARLAPDLGALAGVVPPDRLAAALPLLAKVRAWLDHARDT